MKSTNPGESRAQRESRRATPWQRCLAPRALGSHALWFSWSGLGAPTRLAALGGLPQIGCSALPAPARPQGETRAAHAAGALAPPMHVFENANLWARCTHKSEFS